MKSKVLNILFVSLSLLTSCGKKQKDVYDNIKETWNVKIDKKYPLIFDIRANEKGYRRYLNLLVFYTDKEEPLLTLDPVKSENFNKRIQECLDLFYESYSGDYFNKIDYMHPDFKLSYTNIEEENRDQEYSWFYINVDKGMWPDKIDSSHIEKIYFQPESDQKGDKLFIYYIKESSLLYVISDTEKYINYYEKGNIR